MANSFYQRSAPNRFGANSHRASTKSSIYPNLSCSLLFLSVQEGQVALPKNGEYPREHESILGHDKRKAEGRNSRPQLERVFDANWNGLLDPVNDAGRRFSRKDCLHSEEIGVEDGGKDGLLDGHFGGDGEDLGGVIEMVSKEEEPAACQ